MSWCLWVVSDDQVKVRGFRIELGEIAAVVVGLSGCVLLRMWRFVDGGGDARIVLYVVGGGSVVLDAELVREFVAERLPSYMVPSAVVVLGAIAVDGWRGSWIVGRCRCRCSVLWMRGVGSRLRRMRCWLLRRWLRLLVVIRCCGS